MRKLKTNVIWGIIFVSIVGTLFHFIYEWSGNNILVSLFAPINESIWEHTKLIFFPMLIYSFSISKKMHIEYPSINSAMILGGFIGVALIIILFYTYSGIMGFHTTFVDISIFYISVIAAFLFAYKLTISCKVHNYSCIIYFLQIMMIYLFVFFTFYPPNIQLFISP